MSPLLLNQISPTNISSQSQVNLKLISRNLVLTWNSISYNKRVNKVKLHQRLLFKSLMLTSTLIMLILNLLEDLLPRSLLSSFHSLRALFFQLLSRLSKMESRKKLMEKLTLTSVSMVHKKQSLNLQESLLITDKWPLMIKSRQTHTLRWLSTVQSTIKTMLRLPPINQLLSQLETQRENLFKVTLQTTLVTLSSRQWSQLEKPFKLLMSFINLLK